MADYYPLLARAVAALPNSSREYREAIYDRARKALLGQLRSLDPPVSPEHLDAESNALDDAIARLEAELGQEASASSAAPAKAPDPQPPPPPPSRPGSPPALAPASAAPPAAPPAGSQPPLRPPPPPVRPAPPPPASMRPAPGPPPRPAPPAPPARPVPPAAPAPLAGRTGPAEDLDRPRDVRPALDDEAAPPRRKDERPQIADEADKPAVVARPPTGAPRSEAARPVAPTRPEQGRGVSRQMLIWVPIILLIGSAIGFAAWRLRVPPEEFSRPRVAQSEPGQPQGSGKINDRAGAPGTAAPPQQAQPPRQATTPAQQAPARQAQQQPAQQPSPAQQRPPVEQGAPVAQRAAILVQAAVNDQQNVETHVGTTVWRLEESRRPNANGSPALRADVDIPAVGLRMVFLIEKNNDPTLRASHMLTFRFLPQEGAALPAIAEMGSPQMRNETAPGVEPLAGAQAKITEQIYIVALNADPAFAARNLDTMRTRGWFDIPIRLADSRIAKITIEKGAPGDRLLSQAIEQWQR